MDNKHLATLGLVAATLIWAVAGISWRIFLELGFAFVFIFIVSRIFKFLCVLLISYFRVKRHEPIKNRGELWLIFLNALFSVGTPFFFVLAISHTKISNAYFLQYTMPAWVMITAVMILGEKFTAKKAASVALAIIGILFVARPEDLLNLNTGVVFGLLSAISHTGDIITSRELKDYSYHTISVYSNAMQLLISLAFIPFFPLPQLGGENTLGLVLIVASGILLGIASDMYYLALHWLEASTAAIISFLELIFASLLAFIFFSEAPTVLEAGGYTLILFASTVIVLRKSDIGNFERLLHFTDRQ